MNLKKWFITLLKIKNTTLNSIKKEGIEGTLNIKEDGFICFEIAYDKGWQIEVDGKKVASQAIYDVFLGVKLEKGQHNIKIYYIPEGFVGGALISVFSGLVLSVLLIIYERNKCFYK